MPPRIYFICILIPNTCSGTVCLCSIRSVVSSLSKMGHQINKWNVAHSLQKRKLLIAINFVAGLSIFFFGYDQGMMGGVNNAKDYIEHMGFGYVETIDGSPNTPVITNSLLQGGIVSVYYLGTLVGALAGGWVGEKVGRIKTIALGAAWGVLGASLQCSAQNHIWMIFGKVPIVVLKSQGGC